MTKPPTLRELMDDPAYRAFIKVIPRLPQNLDWGSPWAVYKLRTDGRWFGGQFADYREAWGVTVKAMRSPGVEDVAIVSRRLLITRMPVGYQVPWGMDWCNRCRRPTTWSMLPPRGGAVIASSAETYRCYYCRARAVLAAKDPRSYYVYVD